MTHGSPGRGGVMNWIVGPITSSSPEQPGSNTNAELAVDRCISGSSSWNVPAAPLGRNASAALWFRGGTGWSNTGRNAERFPFRNCGTDERHKNGASDGYADAPNTSNGDTSIFHLRDPGKEMTMSDIDSKEFVLAGIIMKRLLSGEQTAGQFCLFENRSDGNTRTPIHVHAWDDETVYIIEGELTAVIDGRPRCLSAGESIFLPRDIPHQLMNTSGDPCRYILIGTPALFERFIEEGGHELQQDEVVGPPTPKEIERLREASPKFGITLLLDWPPPR
jgi:mannose-6-phosphate isomerase-like protein (cupin superfamily)